MNVRTTMEGASTVALTQLAHLYAAVEKDTN